MDDKEIKKIVLDKVRRSGTAVFDKEFFIDAKMSERSEEVIIKMTAHVAARIVEPQLIKIPRTWWDFFKHSHFPRWMKKRFPVRLKNYDAVLIFPELLKKLHEDEKGLLDYLSKEFKAQFVFMESKENVEEREGGD